MNTIQKPDLIGVDHDYSCIVIAIMYDIVYYLDSNGRFCRTYICDVIGHWNEYDMFITNKFYTFKYE